jgi:hypothetical protein
MIKKFIFIFSLFISFIASAQEGTSSPYSFYGIGDVKFRGNIEVRSMGEVSVIPDSIHINLLNPAMMSNIKLTTFSAAGTFSPVVLKTSSQTEKAQRTTLDYLSVVMPAKKFAIGFGLMPYTAVGYNILNRSTPNFVYTFDGSGGVNKVYTAVSFKLSKQFNFGVEGQYNFGEIETVNTTSSTIETRTKETNVSSIGGFNVNFGLTHQAKINKTISIFSGLTFTPETNLNLSNTRNIAIIQFSSNDQELIYDQIDVDVPNSKIKSPSKISFGTSIGELKKWVVGAQVTAQSSSDFGNRIENVSNASYEDGLKFSFGGYYIPKYNSFTNYLSRITYRGGFRYENTGLVINNVSILDRAVTFGLGLPLNGTFSNINIGFEYGKRGTTNAGLIEENYSNISFGFSFNDKWFQRRQYN